jgi:hypothetical protein
MPFMQGHSVNLHHDLEADLVVTPVPGDVGRARNQRYTIGKVKFRLPILASFNSNRSEDQERLRPVARESISSSIFAVDGSLVTELDSDSVVDLGPLTESELSSSLTIATNMAMFKFPRGPLALSSKSQTEELKAESTLDQVDDTSPALASTIDNVFGDEFAISPLAIAIEGNGAMLLSRFSTESESSSVATGGTKEGSL